LIIGDTLVLAILFELAARVSPIRASSPAFAILAGIALGLFVFPWWRSSRLSTEFQRGEDAPLPQDGVWPLRDGQGDAELIAPLCNPQVASAIRPELTLTKIERARR
jgi:hypothetical protein